MYLMPIDISRHILYLYPISRPPPPHGSARRTVERHLKRGPGDQGSDRYDNVSVAAGHWRKVKMMNIDDLTIEQAKQLAALFGVTQATTPIFDNGMVGKYVVVRCRDGGVHSGVLKAHNGRECLLTDARRLWYFDPRPTGKWLSGVATTGINHQSSKVGVPVELQHLTEDCEIILCTKEAEASIRGCPANG